MDPNFLHRVNVAAVKKVDPAMNVILDSATHVALYSFNSNDNKWEKTEIEGALFLYSRTTTPTHAFIVLNRLNTENLVEYVNAGLDFQIKEPFLLYKTQQSLIYGIWFYDQSECYRVTANLQKLVKSLQDKSPGGAPKEKRKDGVGGVDIFSMLSKAQEDFNTRNKPDGKMEPQRTDLTAALPIPIPTAPSSVNSVATTVNNAHPPPSVLEFFAKASSSQPAPAAVPEHKPPAPGPMPGFFPPPNPTFNVASSPQRSEENMKPLLMRLMSNPVHSVEHIEKQQRSVTPDAKMVVAPSLPEPQLQQQQQQHQGQVAIENGFKLLRMSPPVANLFGTPPSNSVREISPLSGERPPSAGHQHPPLMPPVMFATPTRSDGDKGEIGALPWNLGMSPPMPVAIAGPPLLPVVLPTPVTAPDSLAPLPQPLTRNQMLQAISYLIKHDTDFINKLHEAYVKSFNEMLASNS